MWLDEMHVLNCFGMFAVLRPDVLFINPQHNDSILLNPSDGSRWSNHFTQLLRNSKFKYIILMVSLNNHGVENATSRSNDEGNHWIAAMGDVDLKVAWTYDSLVLQCSNPLPLRILSAVMSFKTGTIFQFTASHCPFKFVCQRAPDGKHCGVWSLMLILNWCMQTLPQYEQFMVQIFQEIPSNLINFAMICRQALCADLHQKVVDQTMFFCKPPVIEKYNSSFWTVTNEMHFLSFLRNKFHLEFEEKNHSKGKLRSSGLVAGDPWEAVKFFVSSKSVVKVYRSLFGVNCSSTIKHLAQALHEASATAYVCSKKNWYFQVFGVITQGARAAYIHVCIVRSLLDDANVANLNVQQASSAFVDLLKLLGLVHGDPHPGNAKMMLGLCKDIQVIDFERSFWQKAETFMTSFHLPKNMRQLGVKDAYS